jgi:hypothetical protein
MSPVDSFYCSGRRVECASRAGPGGFVVVEMDDAAAEIAIAAVDGTDVGGQALNVKLA